MAVAVEVSFHGQGATLENYLKTIEQMGATLKDRTQIQPVCSTG